MKTYDTAEPIEAYRWWRTSEWQHRLVSASFDFIWRREVTALPCLLSGMTYTYGARPLAACDGPPCREGRQESPIARGCGIYAVKSLSDVWFNFGSGGVIGKVLLGGTVWPYTHGYRSEKAKIVGLYSPKAFREYERYVETRPMSWAVEQIANSYGVPVLTPTPEQHDAILSAAQVLYAARLVSRSRNFYVPRAGFW